MIKILKKAIKGLCPPVIMDFIRDRLNQYGFFSAPNDWKEVVGKTTGYDLETIFEKVKDASLKVKNKQACYERDSVVFDKVEYSWPLLSGLLWVLSKSAGRLDLIDFGGSLGSSYYQNKFFLNHVKDINWNIVEQDKFVEFGKTTMADDKLKFYASIDDCCKENNPNLIIFSGVLQYLKDPFSVIKCAIDKKFQYIIVDRTTFLDAGARRVVLQKVPPTIYDASYPCWFFNEQEFLSPFTLKYNLVAEFESLGGKIDEHGIKGYYRGFIFELITKI